MAIGKAGSCTLELNESSAARAAKHLPALTIFILGDSSVWEGSAVKGGTTVVGRIFFAFGHPDSVLIPQ